MNDQTSPPEADTAQAIRKLSHWIPVESSLPDYRRRVLLRCRWAECHSFDVQIGHRTSTDHKGEHWTFDSEKEPRDNWNVIAWMPLP